MKKIILYFAALGLPALLVLGSCRKDPLNNLTNEESRIYVTNHDDTTNFANYHTYSIVDSVALIQNNQSGKELNATDLKLLNQIKARMAEAGYSLVDKDQKPDLGINVSKIMNARTDIVNYYPGYWAYPDYGYYDPYYWGYAGYDYYFPNYYQVYNYQENSIAIDMFDLKDATKDNNQLDVVWNAVIRGEGVLDQNNVADEVDAVFDQSTYLKTEK